jgi:hypothetical protein
MMAPTVTPGLKRSRLMGFYNSVFNVFYGFQAEKPA